MLSLDHVNALGSREQSRFQRYRFPSRGALRRSLLEEIEAADDAFLLTGEIIPDFGVPGLTQLRELLASTGAEVRAVAYVREPRAWMTSQVQQGIKTGRTMDEALAGLRRRFGVAWLTPLIEAFGSELDVRLYESHPAADNLLRDFLRALGRDPALADGIDVARENVGLSHRAVVLWEAMNRLNRREERPPFSWIMVTDYLRATVPGPPFRLPKSTLDDLVAEKAEQIAQASEHAGVDLGGLAGPDEDGVDTAWQPDEDHVRTVHRLLADLAEANATLAYRQGRTQLAKGDPASAERTFLRALTFVPTFPDALTALKRLRDHRARQTTNERGRDAGRRPARPAPVAESGRRVPVAAELPEIQRLGHRNFVGGLWEEIGQLQFEFVRADGLQPHHVLLDIGCGALRGGVHFIDYLDRGHYLGIDQHQTLIDRGIADELGQERFRDKRPEFVVSSDFEFERFSRVPDYAIAQSLFTHLTEIDIATCLGRLRDFAEPGCRLLATFFEAPRPVAAPRSGSRVIVRHTREALETVGRERGWRPEYVGDWNHPRDQKMMRFVAV